MTRRAALLLSFLLASPVPAAVAPPRPGPAELVRRLGDPSYLTREWAAQDLLALGTRARPALLEGLKSADAEIKARCRDLLPLLGLTEQDRLLGAFVQTGKFPPMRLPGWK